MSNLDAIFESVRTVVPAAKLWKGQRIYLGLGDSYVDETGAHLFGLAGGGNVADRAKCKAKAAELRAAGLELPMFFRARSGAEEPV